MKAEEEQVKTLDLVSWYGKMCRVLSQATRAQTSEQSCRKLSESFVRKPPPIPMSKNGWSKAGCLFDVDGRWSVAWRVFDAQFWGVPQRRSRIALVADFGGLGAPEILFERKSVSGYSTQSGETGEAITGTAETSTAGNDRVLETELTCYGLDRASFNQGQNAQFSFTILEDQAPTLVAKGPGAVSMPVVYSFDSLASNSMKSSNPNSGCREVGVSRTLDTTRPDPAKNQGGIAICQPVYCLQGNGIDRADTAGCNGAGWKEDVSYTLNTIDRPAVAYESKTVFDARGNGNGTVSPTITGDHENRITDYSAILVEKIIRRIVRRLTPLECERLQGFPDGWTDIGDWTDSKGKKHKGDSDSARYKALGNSIALPPWFYVLQRLSLYCGSDCTMASLFDGIGGFPLIWETLNGKGTCLWASEIEEFAIAVTSARFSE